jgi:hypothetical protein
MRRLYKFFLLLFLAVFVISFIYGVLISWLSYQAMAAAVGGGITIGALPFTSFLWMGLIQSITYTLALYLIILLLFRKSFHNKQPFTIRRIVNITWLFFGVTSFIFLVHLVAYSNTISLASLYLIGGPSIGSPLGLWYPFLIAWVALFTILASRIKKAE